MRDQGCRERLQRPSGQDDEDDDDWGLLRRTQVRRCGERPGMQGEATSHEKR